MPKIKIIQLKIKNKQIIYFVFFIVIKTESPPKQKNNNGNICQPSEDTSTTYSKNHSVLQNYNQTENHNENFNDFANSSVLSHNDEISNPLKLPIINRSESVVEEISSPFYNDSNANSSNNYKKIPRKKKVSFALSETDPVISYNTQNNNKSNSVNENFDRPSVNRPSVSLPKSNFTAGQLNAIQTLSNKDWNSVSSGSNMLQTLNNEEWNLVFIDSKVTQPLNNEECSSVSSSSGSKKKWSSAIPFCRNTSNKKQNILFNKKKT